MKFKAYLENGSWKLDIDINVLLFDEFNDIERPKSFATNKRYNLI